MSLEDCPESNAPVVDREPHFRVDLSFKSSSYASRYDILCRRLVKERLCNSASLQVSSVDAVTDGRYWQLSDLTSLKTFVSGFAGRIATVALRCNRNSD